MSVAPRTPGPAWDLSVRVFHWTLAALVVFSFVTGRLHGGWMQWHMRSGYAILALLIFRLAWGFVGPANARFASFLHGPRAVLGYGRALLAGARERPPGHNPLGAWMVVLLLGILLLQAMTGLFANDEIAAEGPLAAKVSNAVVDRMSLIHSYNEWVIVAAVALHVAAVSFYQWRLGIDLIGSMWRGPAARRDVAAAALILAAACAAVYALVVVYPR